MPSLLLQLQAASLLRVLPPCPRSVPGGRCAKPSQGDRAGMPLPPTEFACAHVLLAQCAKGES